MELVHVVGDAIKHKLEIGFEEENPKDLKKSIIIEARNEKLTVRYLSGDEDVKSIDTETVFCLTKL